MTALPSDLRNRALASVAPPTASSWVPLDLGDALNGAGVPPAELLSRDDGPCLLYRGRTHWFSGEPESCKSWAAQLACAQVLNADGVVLYLDYEDDERGVVERLRCMSVPDHIIGDATRFLYVRPEEPLADRYGETTEATGEYAKLLESAPDLVVLDGVTEAMTVEGLDLRDNANVADFMRRILRPAANGGAAVVALDHVTKSKDDRGTWAIGGQHKKAGVTGASYSFSTVRPFSRGGEGVVRVKVDKDRPGHVRAFADGANVATLVLESYPDGGVRVHLEAPHGGKDEPSPELVARIIDHLTIYPGASKTDLRTLSGNHGQIDDAIKWLIGQDRVRVEQAGRAHRHYLTDLAEQGDE